MSGTRYLYFCFCTPVNYKLEINEYTSWRDIKNTIASQMIIDPAIIKTLLYNNKVIIPNDDFVELIDNMLLYVILDCSYEEDITQCIRQIFTFNRVTASYTKWRARELLSIIYENYIFEDEQKELLTEDQIKYLRTCKFGEIAGMQLKIDKYTTCPISYNEMVDDTDILILPCDHYFVKENIKL